MVNPVVKSDLRVFEVLLSYIGPLYNTRNPNSPEFALKTFLLDAYNHSIYDKKRIRRVPSCSRKRSTKNCFGEHPYHINRAGHVLLWFKTYINEQILGFSTFYSIVSRAIRINKNETFEKFSFRNDHRI